MRVLIIEDEPLAASQLKTLLLKIAYDIEILSVCDTVESSIRWLKENEIPQLIFLDIHLGDGNSFDIFKNFELNVPVIFTTAFDQYAIKAFKLNSIDYLLKPIDETELRTALDKYRLLKNDNTHFFQTEILQQIASNVYKKEFKKRFLVKIGSHLRSIDTNNVLYFYSFQKGTFLKSTDGRNYLLDQTLETIEQIVDPEHFFRINRKYLLSMGAITDAHAYSNSRLKLKVKYQEEDDFLVAREKVKAFKDWLEGII
jgi:DNA-binding LytR/AlgR family response regulator